MRGVTLIGLVLAGLLAAAMPGAAAPNPAPGAANAPKQTEPAARNPGPQPARTGERRRRSYASCNRESHKRNLRGGPRRRFLIRCKLGYERRHINPPAAPAQPPTPKRP